MSRIHLFSESHTYSLKRVRTRCHHKPHSLSILFSPFDTFYSLASQLDLIRKRVRVALTTVYHVITVEEWLELRINPILRALKMFVGGGSMDEVKEEDEEEMDVATRPS